VLHHYGAGEVIHAGAVEIAVAQDKTAGMDDVDGNAEAGAEAEDRPGVLRNIGLEKRTLDH